MNLESGNINCLLSEIILTDSRSSGAGGQHVNKVNTKVQLRFNVQFSNCLTDNQKRMVLNRLSNRINIDGELVLESQETRSNVRNREIIKEKFLELVKMALKEPKKRKRTKPSFAAKKRRLQEKKRLAEKKQLRKRPSNDGS